MKLCISPSPFFYDNFPEIIRINTLGEKHSKVPFVIGSYLKLDENQFKRDFSDQGILDWLHNSANGTEDFELEFKAGCPPKQSIKKIVVGFSNTSSGVLGIGFNDDGTIWLSGLDDPR